MNCSMLLDVVFFVFFKTFFFFYQFIKLISLLTACLQDLEEGLLESEKEGGCEFLTELVCKLLNGCYGREDIWWVSILSETGFSSQIVPKCFFCIIYFVLI